MTQEDMDAFLASLGAVSNPFSVQDLFDGRTDEVAWMRIQKVLKMDDGTAVRVALALKRASRKPPSPAALPKQKNVRCGDPQPTGRSRAGKAR